MLIGLSGKKRSGKDTVAAHLVEQHDFVRVAFAGPLREMALKLNPVMLAQSQVYRLADAVHDLGWDEAKEFPEVRAFLQNLGVACREVDEDFWVNAAARRIDALLGAGRSVVVTDVRFRNEAELIDRMGWFVVRVERPGLVSDDAHVSETALDNYPHFDHMLTNKEGRQVNLFQQVDHLISDLL